MTNSTHRSGSGKGLAIATLATIFITIIVTQILNIVPPPGGELVAKLASGELNGVLILPANYAFAIWGFIYIGIIAYGFYQLQPARREDPRIQRVNVLLITSCIAQMLWMVLFPLRLYGISILAMLGLLIPLIGIYLTLDIGKSRADRKARWSARIPFSTYLAWISVATIVNVASALYRAEWNGWGLSSPAWTVVMLIVGAVIAAVVALQRADTAFVAVFVWAYIAIAIRRADMPLIWGTAAAAAAVMLILLAVGRSRRPAIRESTPDRSTTRV
ncbi:MAG TPA: tryptophan-rich sensory protein [Trichocoleus sp.]